jgi:DNA-binding CsgD family transcriptional regulator/tetratricopeptide (TPR) repeat protein
MPDFDDARLTRTPREEAPVLVGREPQLSALRSALEATAQGSGGCDVLSGQPGIGKSRLIEEARLIAGDLDITVAAGGAIELDRVAPARTLTSALRSLGGELTGLGRSPADGPGEPALPYIDDLAEALDRCARSRPLLVAIDDMQWADELSALALRILVPTLAASPVRWLLARRPVPARTAGQDTVDWLVSEGARELPLGRLSEDAVEQLCSHLLGATADATVLALTGRARGNPFLIEQLLKAMLMSNQILISDGLATVVGSELPSSFLSAVDQRLRGLSDEARRLLETGSVFGRTFTVHEAAQLAGVAPPVMAGAAAEALSSGLLVEHEHRLDFAHDLLRQAVYDHTPKPVRAAMHREAAAALRTRGGPAVEVAEHLIRGGDTGDRDAVNILRVAARDVAGRAPGAAADLIVRAVSMLDEQDPARSELSAEAVSLLASAGRLVEAQQAGEVALRGDLDGPVEAKALCGLAEALKHAGHNAAAAQYARRGLARPGVPDDVRARLQAVAAHALLWERDMAGAERAGAEADRLGVSSGNIAASVFGCAARSVVAMASGRLADSVAHAERGVTMADEAGGEALHQHPRIWFGNALAAVDRIADARMAYADGRFEAERLGTAWSMPLWHCFEAEALVVLGELDSAVAEAEAGLLIAGQLTARQMSMPLLSLLVTTAVLRDDLAGAHQRWQQLRDLTEAGVTTAEEDLAWAAAVLHDADDEPGQALRDLTYIYDGLPERLLLLAHTPSCGPILVRMALAADDRDRAAVAAAATQQLADQNPTVVSLAGIAAHARGVLTGELDAFRTAVSELERGPRRLDLAWAMEDCGVAEGRTGERTRGVELLQRAMVEYQACGAHRGAKRTERHLDALGVRPSRRPQLDTGRPLTLLTATQLRVAYKVAEGCSNREVAEALHMSRHTVDTHLRGAFQRLGVNSRVELTRLMMTEPDPRR